MQQAMQAKNSLEQPGLSVSLWSITSFVELQRDALATAQANRDNPLTPAQVSVIEKLFGEATGAIIAVTDYMASLAQASQLGCPLGMKCWAPMVSACRNRAPRCEHTLA